MQYQPLFSILIANYNNCKYLMEAIESVRQQTYANWEVVLVDDASTDNSVKLYAELEQDERIHIYYNEQNMGCGYTKRRCAELAKGEFCGFLDADDVLTNEALQVMVDAHIHYPKASLIYSRYVEANENLQNQSRPIGASLDHEKSYLESINGWVSHFATFKLSAYKKTEGIGSRYTRAVDQDLYLKLDEVGEIIFIDKVLYIYRQGTGMNISLGKTNVRKALCWEMLARVEACERRSISIDKLAFNKMLKWLKEMETEASLQKELEIRASRPYRLGKVLLEPFGFLRAIINKKK